MGSRSSRTCTLGAWSSGPWPRTFDTATASGELQLTMVLAFSEWWRNSIRERSIAGQLKAREEGRFPGRPTVLTDRQKAYVREELAKVLEVSRWNIRQVAEGAPVPAV